MLAPAAASMPDAGRRPERRGPWRGDGARVCCGAARPAPATAPRAHLLADPRLPDLLKKALRKHGMEDWFEHAVVQLVSGETDPRSLMCCNSGCHPCAKDYLGAAEYVLSGLRRKRKRFLLF
jgi:hypothetical protein